MASLNRVKQISEDKEGDIVVTIVKFNFIECLFHSIYGVVMAAFVVGAIALFLYGRISLAIVVIAISFLLWVVSWLNANDVLKQRIYSTILVDYLKARALEGQEPLIAKFFSNSTSDYIKCVASDGSVSRFKVEVIMEKLPLYVVKIHTKPVEC